MTVPIPNIPLIYHVPEDILTMLKESNEIEGVTDMTSYMDAIAAWNFIIAHKRLHRQVILTTHALLMRNQDLEPKYKGLFRDCPVWIGHREGMKHYMIDNAIDDWIDDVNCTYPLEEQEFIDFHVRFEKIHPFIDGNGRIGRILLAWHQVRDNFTPTIFLACEKLQKYYPLFDEKK